MGLLSLPREFGLIIPTPGAYKGHPKWHRRRNIERVSHHHHAATHYHAAAHHHHQAEHHHAVGEHEEAKKHAAAAKEHSELAHKHTTDAQTHSHKRCHSQGRPQPSLDLLLKTAFSTTSACAASGEAIKERASRIGIAASTHPLLRRELPALRRLKREQHPPSPFVFTSERGAPFALRAFRAMVARLGEAARFEYLVHRYQLRHACGYVLVNQGADTQTLQDYLGHRNI
jgi:integrase